MGYALLETPIGPIGLRWEGETLTGVDLEPDSDRPSVGAAPPEPLTRQLERYFADGHRTVDLPSMVNGTEFQRRVWSLLRAIPPGQTRTYGAIARELGSAPRAVGQACRANPLPVVVPCHRVVGARGLGGFAGDTSGRKLAVKQWLLRHEGVAVP